MQILPVLTSVITTLLFNQTSFNERDGFGRLPRALLSAFIANYLLRQRSLLSCLGAIALCQIVFYPPFLFILAGILILRLWRWEGKATPSINHRLDYVFLRYWVGLSCY